MKNLHFDKFVITKMPELKLDAVKSVYIGKPNTCMCGCAGKYTYTNENRLQASKSRGYEVTDDEINDKRVQYVINKMKNNAKDCSIEVYCSEIKLEDNDKKLYKVLFKEYIFTMTVGQTQYTIYTI